MIVSIWGIEGSGKSTIGLTFPSPLFHLDLDVGGFDRAIWRVEDEAKKSGTPLRIRRCEPKEDISKIDWNNWDIVSKPYLVPVQLEKLMGAQKVGASVRFPRKVLGYKELWQELVIDWMTVCQVPAVKTIMADSATQQWTICHTSLLQEKQEIQVSSGLKDTDPKFREQLLPIEYPNDRMREMIYTVKSFGKNLVMTHYPKAIYKSKVTDRGVESYDSGEVEPDGFKHTVKLDDIVLLAWTEVDKNREMTDMSKENFGKKIPNPNYGKPRPFAKVDLKCGLPGMGMTAVGLELPSPSYRGLVELQTIMRGE